MSRRRLISISVFPAVLLVLVAVAVFIVAGTPLTADVSVAVEEEAQKLSPEMYTRVELTRERLVLSNRTLAAMECDYEQSKAVFKLLLEWSNNKVSTMDGLFNRQYNLSCRIDQLRRETRTSLVDDNTSEIRKLSAELSGLIQSEYALFDELKKSISTLLNDDQKAIWRNAVVHGAEGDMRYLDEITHEQLKTIRANAVVEARRNASGESPKPLSGNKRNILTQAQETQLEAIKATIRRCLPDVSRASKDVLPPPLPTPASNEAPDSEQN